MRSEGDGKLGGLDERQGWVDGRVVISEVVTQASWLRQGGIVASSPSSSSQDASVPI